MQGKYANLRKIEMFLLFFSLALDEVNSGAQCVNLVKLYIEGIIEIITL